jgi:glycolate oxidase FAD binding subunit
MTMPLPPRRPILEALREICGPDFARNARSVDAVAGRRASFVAVPSTTDSVAALLRLAEQRNLATIPRGSGSKIDWGFPPPGVDLLIDTGRLNGMWDHQPSALVADVATGTKVSALQAALALRGQRLAVDPPSRNATVGGMLAVNESGPLRHRFGPPAAQVDRISYVDLAGEPLESDGEDGHPGIAEVEGVITSARVRLQPLPAARRWVGVAVSTPLQVHNLVEEALELDLDPSAIEVDLPTPTGDRTSARPPGTLAILLEGDREDVQSRAHELASSIGDHALMSDKPPPWWGRYPFTRHDVAMRISVAIGDLHAAVYALSDAVGGQVPIRGSAGLGTVNAVLPASLGAERVENLLETLRHVLLARGGRAVIISAPPEIAAEVEMAGRRDLF